jgi:hypothetical protein
MGIESSRNEGTVVSLALPVNSCSSLANTRVTS